MALAPFNTPTSKYLSPRTQSVLNDVKPGDVVILENGEYVEDLKTRVSGELVNWCCYTISTAFVI